MTGLSAIVASVYATSAAVVGTVRVCALVRTGLVAIVAVLVAAIFASGAQAQVAVVGASSSTSSTTFAGRKSFVDSATGIHWAFWYSGTLIEYASSPDGSTWTSRGTLPFATSQFSLASKEIGGTSFVFVTFEEPPYSANLQRGTITGTSITFSSTVLVWTGTSETDRYINPVVSVDEANFLWLAALYDRGPDSGERYQARAARTTSQADDDPLNWVYAADFVGSSIPNPASLALLPVTRSGGSSEEVVLAVSGVGSSNIVTYHYSSPSGETPPAWGEVSASTAFGWTALSSPMLSGNVNALVSRGDGTIYAGGFFSTAGGVVVNNIARWDGGQWHALGTGMNDEVAALALDAEGNLYAGGSFTAAGGVSAAYIAMWNGTSWSALGSGMDNTVLALAVHSSGEVFAGGTFSSAGGVSASRIARWSGSAWNPLQGGVDGTVRALAFAGGPLGNGYIYVGGDFANADGNANSRIAIWHGTGFQQMGSGVDGSVRAIAYEGGGIYAAGAFSNAGGNPASGVARWNGSSWSALGAGVDNTANSLVISGGNLYVGGTFSNAGGSAASRIARWDGSAWNALGLGTDSSVLALALDYSGRIVAGGNFITAQATVVNYAAAWDTLLSQWEPLGGGINGDVLTAAIDSGGSGDLFIGGSFTRVGGSSANYIARWNGTTWAALGDGADNQVFSIVSDGAGELYIGGAFATIDGVSASRVARRASNGTWSALGAGVNDSVYAIVPDGAGNVYFAGDFTSSGFTMLYYIAKWDGAVWLNVGGGANNPIQALAFHGGVLYAGGTFTTAGGNPADRIAQFSGGVWSALGSGLNEAPNTMAGEGSNLYVGGLFTTAGGVTVNYIARWTGSAWLPLGTGADGEVTALGVDGSANVYASGSFGTMGGVSAARVAKWNGTSWSALGSGLSGSPRAIAITSSGKPYIAGDAGLLSYGRNVAVNDLSPASKVSLVSASGNGAYMSYIDSSSDAKFQALSGTTILSWGSSSTIQAGAVASLSTSYLADSGDFVTFFVDNGEVRYSQASSPYTSWSASSLISSSSSPREVSSCLSSSGTSGVVALWNRAGGSAGEVAGYLMGEGSQPTATPTASPTPTQTPTPTETPTPTATPPPISPGQNLAPPAVVVQGRTITVKMSRFRPVLRGKALQNAIRILMRKGLSRKRALQAVKFLVIKYKVTVKYIKRRSSTAEAGVFEDEIDILGSRGGQYTSRNNQLSVRNLSPGNYSASYSVTISTRNPAVDVGSSNTSRPRNFSIR